MFVFELSNIRETGIYNGIKVYNGFFVKIGDGKYITLPDYVILKGINNLSTMLFVEGILKFLSNKYKNSIRSVTYDKDTITSTDAVLSIYMSIMTGIDSWYKSFLKRSRIFSPFLNKFVRFNSEYIDLLFDGYREKLSFYISQRDNIGSVIFLDIYFNDYIEHHNLKKRREILFLPIPVVNISDRYLGDFVLKLNMPNDTELYGYDSVFFGDKKYEYLLSKNIKHNNIVNECVFYKIRKIKQFFDPDSLGTGYSIIFNFPEVSTHIVL